MMRKTFNTTAVCIPGEHYMVDISGRLQKIKEMIAAKKYFTINRARSMVRQQRCRHFSAICKVNITPSCWTFKPLMLLNLRMAIYFLLLSQALFCMR